MRSSLARLFDFRSTSDHDLSMNSTIFLLYFFVYSIQALKGVKREQVQLATKFGVKFKEGMAKPEFHGEPDYVRACCEASLKRLDVDYIDLYYVHRIDTKVPIEITVCLSFRSFHSINYFISFYTLT